MTPSVRRPLSAQSSGGLQWYVIKVRSGREQAVMEALQRRIRLEGLTDGVGRIIIPVEKIVAVRNGRVSERTRKLFPGYVLCEMMPDDRTLALVRETPGVCDFASGGAAPVPLSAAEAARWVAGQLEDRMVVVRPEFAAGDRVRVLRGAFAQLEGEVAEVVPTTGQVRIRVSILGRPALLELDPAEVLHLGRLA